MSNLIFAVNAGSSSLKFQLFDMAEQSIVVLTKGMIERIGLSDSIVTVEVNGTKVRTEGHVPNHTVAVDVVLKKLIQHQIIHQLEDIRGVGHRVVHGGEIFKGSVVIDEDVMTKIHELSALSPLHNPANITGIEAFRKALPNVPMVAVFDTAFHQTMPEKAYLYSIPTAYYEQFGVRKYGFHGTSHQYVSEQAAAILKKPVTSLKIISCHLGNGASIAAIEGGRSIDTSMGFTPLEGLTMGTRAGNIDAAVIPFLMKKLDKTADEVIEIFNKQSGMLGLSGFSSDLRDIEKQITAGNEQAMLAFDIFVDRIKKHIGMYAAVMGGVDAIIFTAGIGENSPLVRERVMDGLDFLGAEALVIPTNEELMIARDTVRLMKIAR